MTTANTLIADALGSLGVIGSAGTLGGSDALTGLRVLNRMLDAWRLQPHMATHAAWVTFSLPSGTSTRTIGPTGQVVTARPSSIEVGGFSRIGGVDQPLSVITRDQYANAQLKTQAGGWPCCVYYEAASPNGTLYFWPLAAATIYLPVRTHLDNFADLTTEVTLPAGYEAAIVPSLAVKLAPYFERQVPATVVMESAAARSAIKRTNASVPELDICQPVLSGYGAFLGG